MQCTASRIMLFGLYSLILWRPRHFNSFEPGTIMYAAYTDILYSISDAISSRLFRTE